MKKADKDLFVLGLGAGGLVQLTGIHVRDDGIKNHGVVVGYVMKKWLGSASIYIGNTFHFKYIANGTLAIYLGRSDEAIRNKYFSNFHSVFCDNSECIVHEKYMFPADLGLNEEEEWHYEQK
tara:strand:+ start:126 stop:491 length:366 start_codon:yes stop_codon:yes gene_type:complete